MSGARRSDDGAAARSCIRVACRIRPTSASEAAAPSCVTAHTAGASLTAHSISGDTVFAFDSVLTPEAAQADVYDQTARRVVDDFLDGFNGTVFVYGQTGSGKTHTMIGDVSGSDSGGIAPRAFAHVFDAIASSPPSSEFLLTASFVEIYQEKVRDLLNPRKTDLRIREGAACSGSVSTSAGRSGVWIEDAEEVRVSSPAECLALLSHGLSSRSTASTHLNERSSRSHAAFMLSLSQKVAEGHARVSQLFLVDLAGSERVKKSRVEGEGMDQAVAINKSLHALGNVIAALSATPPPAHVPYRDSKLTRILQESLGGNARTCVVTCISPSQKQEAETISTLRFGVRAKKVTNCAKVNTQRSFADIAAALAAAEAEIQRLRFSSASGGGASQAAELQAAATAELHQRSMLEGELQAWREREAAVSADVDASRTETAKYKTDLSKYMAISADLSAEVQLTMGEVERLRGQVAAQDEQLEALRLQLQNRDDAAAAMELERKGFIQKIEDLSLLIETLNPASPAKDSSYSVPSTAAVPPAATTPRHLPMSSAVAVSAARAAAAFTSSAAAAAAAVPDFTSSPPLRSPSPSNPQPASTASPDSVFFSDLQVAIDKNIQLTEELNDERESRRALLQLMQSSALSPNTRRTAELERRCSHLQQQLRASSGLVKSLSQEIATFNTDCEAKRKRIALLEMLLSDHEAVVSSRYATCDSRLPAAATSAPRPFPTLRGGAGSVDGAAGDNVSSAFMAWLNSMGGKGQIGSSLAS